MSKQILNIGQVQRGSLNALEWPLAHTLKCWVWRKPRPSQSRSVLRTSFLTRLDLRGLQFLVFVCFNHLPRCVGSGLFLVCATLWIQNPHFLLLPKCPFGQLLIIFGPLEHQNSYYPDLQDNQDKWP